MRVQVIEGTWEEIQSYHAELAGRRLRVIVLPEPEAADTVSGATLLEYLTEIGFVGQWADRTDLPDSPEYVRQVRRQAESRQKDVGTGH
jgi:hypothetical protein